MQKDLEQWMFKTFCNLIRKIESVQKFVHKYHNLQIISFIELVVTWSLSCCNPSYYIQILHHVMKISITEFFLLSISTYKSGSKYTTRCLKNEVIILLFNGNLYFLSCNFTVNFFHKNLFTLLHLGKRHQPDS